MELRHSVFGRTPIELIRETELIQFGGTTNYENIKQLS